MLSRKSLPHLMFDPINAHKYVPSPFPLKWECQPYLGVASNSWGESAFRKTLGQGCCPVTQERRPTSLDKLHRDYLQQLPEVTAMNMFLPYIRKHVEADSMKRDFLNLTNLELTSCVTVISPGDNSTFFPK